MTSSFISALASFVSLFAIVYALSHTLFSFGRVIHSPNLKTVLGLLWDSPIVPHNGSRGFSVFLLISCVTALGVCTVLGTSYLTAFATHCVICGSLKAGYAHGHKLGTAYKTAKASAVRVATKLRLI